MSPAATLPLDKTCHRLPPCRYPTWLASCASCHAAATRLGLPLALAAILPLPDLACLLRSLITLPPLLLLLNHHHHHHLLLLHHHLHHHPRPTTSCHALPGASRRSNTSRSPEPAASRSAASVAARKAASYSSTPAAPQGLGLSA